MQLRITHSMLVSPLPRNLLIAPLIILVLLRNASLHSIIGHGLSKQLAGESQDSTDLGTGLPFVGAQHAQAHAAFLVVGHVGVVDFCSEGDGGRLEGVVGWERELDEEFSVLYRC